MRKLTIIFILAVGLGLVYFLSRSKNLSEQTNLQTESATQAQIVKTGEVTKSSDKNENTQSVQVASGDVSASAANTGSNSDTEKLSTPTQKWIHEEAKNLNQPHVDSKQKDLELKRRIENMTDVEKKELVQVALNSQSSANDRILSAYILGLDQSRSANENLVETAKKALPDFGPLNAHSEAELRRSQELAIRYMPIDELAKRAAANDSEALQALKQLAQTAESTEVRNYVQRILSKIK